MSTEKSSISIVNVDLSRYPSDRALAKRALVISKWQTELARDWQQISLRHFRMESRKKLLNKPKSFVSNILLGEGLTSK
jgi:hypothetical protein